ncbi:MAG: sensor histidine kinase [Anaerolineae bacterium]
MRQSAQGSAHRIYRLFGWADKATATMAIAFYSFMSIAFGVLAAITLRSVGESMGPVRLSVFAVLLPVHTILHWFGPRLTWSETKSLARRVAYCVIQAGLIYALSALTGDRVLTLGLWVTLLAETVALLWPEWQAMALAGAFYLGLMALNATLLWGLEELIRSVPAAVLALGGVLLYALLLAREAWNRMKAQELLQELRATQSQLQQYAEQVEKLTISQERERMAREMHDTLAQGLAGVIMQLEAADSHLESNRPAEAQVVVEQAMQRARQTLHEARRAIQALRSAALEQRNLAAALATEVSQFEVTSGVTADLVFDGEPEEIRPEVAQHVLRIAQESLSNIGRHAHARHVRVRLVQSDTRLELVVQDDGKGFDVEAAMLRADCFGLQGMYERAQRLGATLQLESAPQEGTVLALNLEDLPKPELDMRQASVSGAVGGTTAGKAMTQ